MLPFTAQHVMNHPPWRSRLLPHLLEHLLSSHKSEEARLVFSALRSVRGPFKGSVSG